MRQRRKCKLCQSKRLLKPTNTGCKFPEVVDALVLLSNFSRFSGGVFWEDIRTGFVANLHISFSNMGLRGWRYVSHKDAWGRGTLICHVIVVVLSCSVFFTGVTK